MKKPYLFLLIMLVTMSTGLFAQSLFNEDFTGLTLGNLGGQSGWTKSGTGPDLTVANTSPLTYTNYRSGGAEYVVIPTPGSLTSREYKALTSTPAPGTNTFFYSALINLTSTTATGDYFLSLCDATTGYFARLFAKTSGAGFVLGISKNANVASAIFGTTVFNLNTTYLVVFRYTFNVGTTNDQIALWVNPSLTSEPSLVTAEAQNTAAADVTPALVGTFNWHIRTVNNPAGSFDGVRVAYGADSATAWANLDAYLSSLAAEPTAQPTDPQFSNTTSSSFDVAFTAANPVADGYIAIRKAGSAPTTDPVDGTAYTAGSTLGDGTVAYSGAGVTFPESSLNPITTYYYKFYSYNGSGATINYLATTPLEGNHTTLVGVVLPTVTTAVITNIGVTTATGGGNVTADGNGTVDIKGICWNTTGSPVYTENGTNDGAGIGAFTSSLIPLTANQFYYVRAYAHNSAGYAYGNEVTFTTYKAEPVGYPTGFAAGILTVNSIQLNWTDSAADGFLIKGSSVSYVDIVNPADGTPEADGALIKNVLPGAQTYTFTGLSNSTTYYFQIYPYNNSGALIDYKSDGTPPQVTAATLSTPVLTVLPVTLVMNAYVGTTSYAYSAVVTSANLSAGVTVSSTGPFTFSETSGGTYSNPLVLATNYNGSVYIKFSPLSPGIFTELINFDSGATHAEIAPTATGITPPGSAVFVENFEYVAATLLTANGWTAHSGAGVNAIPVAADNLTYTGYPSVTGNCAGTTFTGTTSAEDVNKSFTALTVGSGYMSFLVNIPTTTNISSDYFTHFMSATAGDFKGRVFWKKDPGVSGNIAFGLTKAGAAAVAAFTGYNYQFGTTYLIVMRYDLIPGATNDVIKLWVNPVIGPTEPVTADLSAPDVTGTDIASISAVAIRQGNPTSPVKVDGIRVAHSWALLFPTTTPVINVTGTLSPFTTVVGNPSTPSQSYTLSGSDLNGNITVTAPTGFELSTDNINFSSPLSLSPTFNGLVYVRLTGATAGIFTGNIVHTSPGATPVDLAVSGEVTSPTGYISVTQSLTPFAAITGLTSTVQSYLLAGETLSDFLYVNTATTPGAIFEVRDATGGGTWQTGLALSPLYSGTIEVRFSPTVAGEYAGTITHSSDGATNVVINVTGTATDPAPVLTVEPAAMTFVAPSGSLSVAQIATVTSANLVNPITIGSAGEYVFCDTPSGTYINPLVVAATYNGSIYIKYAPTSIGGPFASSVTFNSGIMSDAISTNGYGLDPSQTYATDLFFSEYIEGTSNNKGLEIFNGTGAPVDLADYTVYLYANGSPTPTNTLAMTGILANNDVYCITNAGAVLAGITSNSDITSTVTYFNGDDAISLWKESAAAYVDIFGVIGNDPGTAWINGAHTTLDRTLVRKSTVIGGVTVNPSGTGVLAFTTLTTEWDVYPIDTVSNYGSHYFTPGMIVAEAPVLTPPAGIQVAPIMVSMSSTTPGAEIRYTTNGTDPTGASDLFVNPFELTATTTVKAKTYAAGYAASATTIGVYTFPVITDVLNIAALRAITLPSTAYYRLTGEAVLTLKSATRNAKYIQDASGAVLIDDPTGKITTSYNLGDGISGIIGTIAIYTGMLQFTPATNPGAPTSTGNIITPQDVTWATMDPSYQGKLVKFSSVSFIDVGNFAAPITYNVTDPSGAGVVRTQYVDLDYIGTAIPTAPKNIVGVILQYTTGAPPVTVMQFVPRSLAEFTEAAPPAAPIDVVVTKVGNDIQLNWANDPAVTSWKVYYSDDPNGVYTLGPIVITNSCLLLGDASTYGKRFYYVTANN
jgi:hypothetical protein